MMEGDFGSNKNLLEVMDARGTKDRKRKETCSMFEILKRASNNSRVTLFSYLF